MEAEELMSVAEVAQRLRVHQTTIYVMLRRGVLHAVRPFGSRAIRLRRSEIEAIVTGNGGRAA
jgi:excisionase family DNA binding protein